MSLEEQKFSFLMRYNLSSCSFMDCACGILSEKSLPNPGLQKFSSRRFLVLGFTPRLMIHFELMFLIRLRYGSNYTYLFCIWISTCSINIC